MDSKQAQAAPKPASLNAGNGIARLATRTLREDDGVTAIEYGLLAALIAVTCIVAFQATGASLDALYEYWSNAVGAAINAAL